MCAKLEEGNQETSVSQRCRKEVSRVLVNTELCESQNESKWEGRVRDRGRQNERKGWKHLP